MKTLNEKMLLILNKVSEPCLLAPSLVNLIENGFYSVENCVFFKSFFSEKKLPPDDFLKRTYVDKTGYECSINSFHIEDYCNGCVVENMLVFVHQFQQKWEKELCKPCVLIVGINDSDFGIECTFRFHIKREGEFWIDPNKIEYFDGGIMTIEIPTHS